MKHKINIKYHHILLVSSIIALIPIIVLCVYDRPCADDYSYGLIIHDSLLNNGNIWDIIKISIEDAKNRYFEHTGAFLISIIQSLHPGVIGIKYYSLAPIIIILCMYVSIRYTIGAINKFFIKQSKIVTISLSLWTLTFFLLWMPSIKEGVYWYNGAANYTISFFASIMNIGLFLHIYNCNDIRKSAIYILASCLLSVISTDCNISVSFTSLIVTFIITFVLIYKKIIMELFLFPFA